MTYAPKFRKAFKIDQKANLRDVSVAVDAIYKANEIATEYLAHIDPVDNDTGFRIRSLLNLLGRVFEHAQAMLVSIATGSPASAEALARIVVEGSINIMYLATFGDSAMLIRFFRSWLGEHDRKLSEWKLKIEGAKSSNEVSRMIEARRQVIVALNNYLQQVETQCSIDTSNAEWPKALFKRFEALGRETDYYESYHRLSGASHITGEDTLIWLMSLNMPSEIRHRLGNEAWAYSILMTRIASIFFVDAVAACVISYGRANNNDLLGCKHSLGEAVHKISSAAGVPLREVVNDA